MIGLPPFAWWFMLLDDEKPSNSLFRRNHFPVLICREFVGKILKFIRDLMSKITKLVKKIANSLLFSLFSGNSGLKSGGIMVRQKRVPTIRRAAHLANRATISTWAE